MGEYKLRIKGISQDRYMELSAFCRQYDEKREKLEQLQEDPSEEARNEKAWLQHGIALIEQCAAAVTQGVPALYSAIIDSVCRGRLLCDLYPDQQQRNGTTTQFFRARRAFFVLLNRIK